MSWTPRDSVVKTGIIFEDTGLLQFSQPAVYLASFENMLEIHCKISIDEYLI